MIQFKKKVNNFKISNFSSIITLVFMISLLLWLLSACSLKPKIDAESSLKDIILSSQLRTAEYTYNSIAEVSDNGTVKYHVAYKGTVTAGCDFKKIEIIKKEKTIYIVVPDIQIFEVIVDPELDYIFIKDKYDTEQTYVEATEACKKDLMSKAQQNETLLSTARESAIDTLNALVKPLEGQLNDGETIQITFYDEMEDSQ